MVLTHTISNIMNHGGMPQRKNIITQFGWAGGIPVTLHYPQNGDSIEEISYSIDGLLMVGGPDLPIHTYSGDQPELLDDDVMHNNREHLIKLFLKP